MAFKKRSYIVTGGAKGIGRAISEHLAEQGAKVAVLDTDRVQGPLTAKRLGKGSVFVPCDLAKPGDIHDAAKSLSSFGKLDGLVNNAGIGAFGGVEGLSLIDWNRVIAVNLTAAFLMTQTFLPKFKKGAAIVNIASTRALMSEPGGEAYGASKGGLLALTHALSLSLQPYHIRVNAVLPGWIDVSGYQGKPGRLKVTKADKLQHPANRIGTPKDVAEAVGYLLDNEKSGFMTGQQLVVDGGITKKMIYV